MKRFSEDDKLFGWWRQSVDSFQKWVAEAKIDRYYFENRQWTYAEAAKLGSVDQPVITINHIYPKVNMLVGLLLQNNPTIHVLPRGREDAELADVANKTLRFIADINRLRSKQAYTFTDLTTTGIGWLETRTTQILGKDPIVIDYVPWYEVIPDPLARMPDYSDSRFIWRGRWVDADICVEFFPQAKKVIGQFSSAPYKGITLNMPGATDREWFDRQRNRVFLVECQYKEFAKTKCFWDGFQAVKYIPSVHDQSLNLGIGSLLEAKIQVVRQAFILGDFVIENNELPYLFNNFTLIPFVAYRDSEGNPIGLVRYLRDMQDEINKRRSKVLHYLTAKRVLAQKGAVMNPKEFLDELSRPDAFLEYNKGFDIKIEQDLELGSQHFQLMQEAANEISTISGIYPDFQGMPTNARTSAAIRQRVMQSQTATQLYFSATEAGLTRLFENCLALARQYYTDQRLIQITDEPYAIVLNEPVPTEDGRLEIRNSLARLRADIVVTIEPGGQTARQQQLVQLVELFKALPQEVAAMSLDVLIDAFDIPQKSILKQRFVQIMQAMMQQQQQQQQQPPEQNRV